MRPTQNKKVWEYLNKHGSITSYDMFDKFNICRASARIFDLRKRYGKDAIISKRESKMRKEYDGEGKEYKVSVNYVRYFLSKFEGFN